MYIKTLLRVSIILFVCLIISFISFAQGSTGKIIGKITDKEGFGIPGVTVILTGTTISPMTTITSESGVYRFLSLPPGEYSIKAELPGFSTQVKERILVQVEETKYVDFMMGAATHADLNGMLVEEMARLSVGKILFNPPKEMRKSIKERIEVRISQNINEDLSQRLRGRGVPQIEEIIVSTVMKVKLSGADFKIESMSEEEQIISYSGFTQWEWDVIPLKSGHRLIYLSIAVIIYLDELGEKKKSYPVMEREIHVKVNYQHDIWNFIKNNWYAIIAAIAALFGIYFGLKQLILASKKKRGEEEKD